MDAKANYPENGKPTWQGGLKLGTAEGGAGLLAEVDSANGLVQGIVEFHRDESTCERACLGEPRSMDAKANYPENGKPTWQRGLKLGIVRQKEELGCWLRSR